MNSKELQYESADWERFSKAEGKPDDERSPAEIDRSRIIHSAAFRRLLGKTQVFGVGQDAFFRTRLTHSLEVAQIAKGVALRVRADVEICEAAALAHDIGHPPYGHRGESVLRNLMKPYGGFEANAQNFRLLGKLEVKYSDPSIRGLDLTKAVLDALLKYREPAPGSKGKFYYTDDAEVREVVEWAKEGKEERPLECEIVDWADDIAYSVHDLEDGIHAGMITSDKVLRSAAEILGRAQIRQPACTDDDLEWAYKQVVRCGDATGARARAAQRKTVTSDLITQFLKVTSKASGAAVPGRARHGSNLDVPATLRRRCEVLKSLAFELLIDDPRVASLEARAGRILTELFALYREPQSLKLYTEEFRDYFGTAATDAERARVACDFIAGMTDEYAGRVYARVFMPVRAALGDY